MHRANLTRRIDTGKREMWMPVSPSTDGKSDGLIRLGTGRHVVSGGADGDTLQLDWRSLVIGIRGGVAGSLEAGYSGVFEWRDDLGPLDLGTSWTQIATAASFSPRDTGDSFIFNGALWLSNGYHTGGDLSRDLWRSTDSGQNWEMVNADTPYEAYSRIEVLGEYMYAMRRSVWRSRDGTNWEEIAPVAPFENAQDRFEMRATVFQDRLWVVAPSAVWSSDDGIAWTKEADLPFDPRFNFALTVFNNRLVIAGGFTGIPNDPSELGYAGLTSFNDVWTSADGRSWERATAGASWNPRQWLHMEEVNGLLYVFGGYSNREARNLNDMWVTKDGVTWTEIRPDDVWSGRHWSSVYVVDNQIILAAGNDSVPGVAQLRNDVWSYTDKGQLSSATFSGIRSFEITLGSGQDNIQLGNGTDVLDGGAGDDMLSAGGGDDRLIGGLGADLLDGGAGEDSLAGGEGDDVYVVDDAGDQVTESAGEGTDEIRTLLAAYSLTALAHVERLTGTSTGGQSLTGNDITNVITGNAGADLLDGGLGADIMAGGAGDDVYVVDDAADLIVEDDEGMDEIRTALSSYSIAALAEIEHLTGTSALSQTLIGNDWANMIAGRAGADLIDGGAGDDTLRGGLGDDGLSGGPGADLLDGGAGADTMAGGADDDVYIVDDTGDVVFEASGEGADEIRTMQAIYSIAAVANVERLTGVSTAGQSLTGNDQANAVTANAGDDLLDGGAGDDILRGEDGDDRILGGAGADLLDGGAGADTMAGGPGDDAYIVDVVGDVVVENAGDGADEVRTALAGYSIAALAQVERLTGSSKAGQSLSGNDNANVITGNAGADVLDGGAGADTLAGHAGDDRLIGGGWAEDRFLAATGWLAQSPGLERWYVADFNGDRRDDLFRYAPRVSGAEVFLSVGDRLEAAGSWTLAGYGTGPWFLGDFDGDGRSDILRYVLGQSGAEVFLSTGDRFGFAGSWSLAGYGDVGWSIGDFNGDGRDDLMRYSKAGSSVQVLLSDGNAFSGPTTWAFADEGSRGWYLGDFNGDGRDDLMRHSKAGSIEVLLSNDAGFDAPQVWYQTIPMGQWRVGDFDHDGRDDLLLVSEASIGAMLSKGSAFQAPIVLATEPSGSEAWYLGDFDGNGGVDLLRQDSGSGVDVLPGSAISKDVFEVDPGFGYDVIVDFAKTDRIDFATGIFDDFAGLLAAARQVNGDVVIAAGLENSLTLERVDLASLTADHFSFG